MMEKIRVTFLFGEGAGILMSPEQNTIFKIAKEGFIRCQVNNDLYDIVPSSNALDRFWAIV